MLIQADARRIPLVDGCVQCCVSSPPYFGLRNYNVDGQIGLEPSPDAFVAALVGVYREVWRVLKDDGVIWVNIGDSYANDDKWGGSSGGKHVNALHGSSGIGRGKRETGLKPKDLCMIPARVAMALQADGWYLRSDIIWAKPNPMPESVTDRPTKAHEYVFLLSKSERYYYDAKAIAEPSLTERQERRRVNGLSVVESKARGGAPNCGVEDTRNARSVWPITTKPYAGAHFATMPEKLAERCILAGSRPGDLVFDPFGGSGTTVRVARKFNRRGVMLDLNPNYLKLAADRISGVQPDIFEVPA